VRFPAFDDLRAIAAGTSDRDEGHEPLLAIGYWQEEAQCAINLSPSPLLEHYLPTTDRVDLPQIVHTQKLATKPSGEHAVPTAQGGARKSHAPGEGSKSRLACSTSVR
jgi:hypothetical protein